MSTNNCILSFSAVILYIAPALFTVESALYSDNLKWLQFLGGFTHWYCFFVHVLLNIFKSMCQSSQFDSSRTCYLYQNVSSSTGSKFCSPMLINEPLITCLNVLGFWSFEVWSKYVNTYEWNYAVSYPTGLVLLHHHCENAKCDILFYCTFHQ